MNILNFPNLKDGEMNTVSTNFDVDEKYKVKLRGVYNRAVYICPHCHKNLLFRNDGHSFYDCVTGLAEQGWSWFYVIECPLCHEYFYYHARLDGYKLFQRSVEHGWNLHYQDTTS